MKTIELKEGVRVEVVKRGDDNFPDYVPLGVTGEIIQTNSDENYPYHVDFGRPLDGYEESDNNYFMEKEIQPVGYCNTHETMVYHDKKETWLCPFCDL